MKKKIVSLENVSKCFDGNFVIKDLSLDVYEGEFFTLLGPSGCGKTTILRMISGLEEVTSGKVYIDGVDVTNIDPTLREVNTIFQNLAIFPHMSVYENIAFGLRMKKLSKEEIDVKVKDAIKLVALDGLDERLPSQLSGGQQQRVALARGIVMNPKVLLLDESLCSLDLKLKRAMQIELKKFQRKLGITFIYVTHDQDEALTMSNRIAIINHGKIEQDDKPQNIYRNPKNVFVADFIGESNIFEGTIVKKVGKNLTIELSTGKKIVCEKDKDFEIGKKVNILIRPENFNIYDKYVKGSIKCKVKEIIYDGATVKLFVKTDDNLKVRVNVNGNEIIPTDELYIMVDSKSIVIME